MDYKEKVRLAKEALESGSYDKETIEYIFPELKESEDERIRKEIIAFLTYYHTGQGNSVKYDDDWIAWLEKQGENNMGISEATKKKLEDNLNNALEKETSESFNEFLDEQGEQKPIESMPEFKEGDILYNKDSCASDSIFIFKGMSDKTKAYLCYARLYDKKDFTVYSKENWDEGVGIYGGEFYPANHKQKELLFSEIEKAGYRWNPDEKKLKKIGQNPAWSEEDEEMVKKVLALIETVEDINKAKDGFLDVKMWLKSLRPQKHWKPSDEQIRILELVIDYWKPNDVSVTTPLYNLLEQLKKLREK